MAHFWKYMQVPYHYESEDGATMEGSKQCTNLLSCTYFFFHEGLGEAGNMKGFLKYANPGTDDYPWRIIFDSVFFVWVGIVLLNVITGLMVDEFASIREEAAERENILDTDCFLCGMKREVYEDMGLETGSPTFDQHLAEDHDIWTIVAYA
jgi:hypothetical protein